MLRGSGKGLNGCTVDFLQGTKWKGQWFFL